MKIELKNQSGMIATLLKRSELFDRTLLNLDSIKLILDADELDDTTLTEAEKILSAAPHYKIYDLFIEDDVIYIESNVHNLFKEPIKVRPVYSSYVDLSMVDFDDVIDYSKEISIIAFVIDRQFN